MYSVNQIKLIIPSKSLVIDIHSDAYVLRYALLNRIRIRSAYSRDYEGKVYEKKGVLLQ